MRLEVSIEAFGEVVSGDCLLLPVAPPQLQVVCIGFAADRGPETPDDVAHEAVFLAF